MVLWRDSSPLGLRREESSGLGLTEAAAEEAAAGRATGSGLRRFSREVLASNAAPRSLRATRASLADRGPTSNAQRRASRSRGTGPELHSGLLRASAAAFS